MTKHECDRGAKRRDLRERQINKDYFASKNLDPEIGVDADQTCCHEKWRQEKNEGIDHRMATADFNASTLVSNREI